MANNVEDFFNVINEKLWHDNINDEAERRFNYILESLVLNKKYIIQDVIDDIERIERVKVEEKEEFEYSTFKKWLNKYMIETMQDYLEDE